MGWESSLEKHPKHVHAIGMISIENANLEIALADLMATILYLPKRVAHAIFFAPRASAVRIQILLDASESILAPSKTKGESQLDKQKKAAFEKIKKIANRSHGVVNRRHEIIHQSWGVHGDNDENVSRQNLSSWKQKGYEPVSLQSLNNLVRDFRLLEEDVYKLTSEFKRHPPMMADMKLTTNSGVGSRDAIQSPKIPSSRKK